MERLVQEYIQLLSSDQAASDKFWALEKRIRKDKEERGVTIMLQKSEAITDIAYMVNDGTITMDDLDGFSNDLKEAVKFYLARWKN